jgi:acyl-CoA thioesterase I
MFVKKLIVAGYIMLFFCFCSMAQRKVACVGNSITFGSNIENREQNSYPAQLDSILGSGWEVRNFGVSGATLLRHGDKPYWMQQQFADAKSFAPDMVVIKLGTNDTKPQNWKFSDEFITDYAALIDTFKDLPSHPMVFICLPAPAYGDKWGIRDSVIKAGIIPMVKVVATANNVLLIDLNTPLRNHPEWFPDLIHPNAAGARQMAELIGKIIRNTWEEKKHKK